MNLIMSQKRAHVLHIPQYLPNMSIVLWLNIKYSYSVIIRHFIILLYDLSYFGFISELSAPLNVCPSFGLKWANYTKTFMNLKIYINFLHFPKKVKQKLFSFLWKVILFPSAPLNFSRETGVSRPGIRVVNDQVES